MVVRGITPAPEIGPELVGSLRLGVKRSYEIERRRAHSEGEMMMMMMLGLQSSYGKHCERDSVCLPQHLLIPFSSFYNGSIFNLIS